MKWKTLSQKQLWQDAWQEVKIQTFETPSGSIGEYLVVSKKQDGAVLIAQNNKQEIAMVKIYRYPIEEEIIQLPVEGIEVHEDDMQAAQRGAKEELGLWARTIEKLGEYYIDPGTLQQKAKIFLMTDLEELAQHQEKDQLEKEMITNVLWYPQNTLKEMIAKRTINDAWTIASLSLLFMRNDV